MSLWDGAADSPRQRRTPKTTKSLPKAKKRKTAQAHGDEGKQKISRDERRRITEAYERGELKFSDCSRAFLLCHCDQSQYPHEIHEDEIGKFELESYGRKK